MTPAPPALASDGVVAVSHRAERGSLFIARHSHLVNREHRPERPVETLGLQTLR